jgi:protein SCO1/2
VTNVRDHSWLERFISTPDRVIAEKDPIAVALYKKYNGVNMPNLRLTDVELHNLIDFLERQSAAHDKDAATADKPGAEKPVTVKADSGQPLE